MAAILNSTMLDSDTAILDSDTFLSSLRFTPKHSPSTLTLTQTNSIWLTWWWQTSWILPSWILAILDSATLVFPLKLTLHLPRLVPTICTKKNLHSFILIQLDDGSHLEFYHVALKNYTHSFWLKLMMAAILNSAMLDWDTLFSSLRFTQKHSHSTLISGSN